MNPMLLKILQQAGKAGKSVGAKAKQAYRGNPSAYQAGGAGALGGLAVGAGLNDNQDALNAMFENFDTSGVTAMSEQNVSKWVKAGVDEDSARWLGMIDTVHERRAELAEDEELSNQFGTMLSAMNVNYLDMDLEHHNQKRVKAGFDPIPPQREDHNEGSREYASKLADASQDIFGMDIDNKEAMRWIRATNVKAPDQEHPEGTVRY
jgi:hypothetical protein